MRAPRHLSAWLLACLSSFATADTVTLDNGDRISGKVERLRAGKLEMDTPYAGRLWIDAARVTSVETDGEMTLIMRDYSRRTGRLVAGAPGTLAIQTAPGATPTPVPPDRVAALLPGRIGEENWRITGRVNAGLTDTSGNTEVRRTNLDAEAVARRNLDRWSLTLRGNQATDRQQQTAENATVGLKYDRFVTEQLYFYGGSSLEHDPFKDIRLRTNLGAGAGAQVLDRATTHLALESGVDRVNTDYFAGQDLANTALRIAIRFDHWVLPDRVQLFHTGETFLSLDNVSRSFTRTQTGLRMPLRDGLLATVQWNLDWDGNPAPGRVSRDQATIISLGYRW
jgi:putative salt-induced outer membrane protein YdiY